MEKNTQVYGLRAIIEAIQANQDVDKVFIQKDISGPLMKELQGMCRKQRIPMAYVPFQKLDRLTKNNHQGAVAQISPIPYLDLDALDGLLQQKEGPALLLLLDQLSDVRNFGAIIRTAECTGVDAIIIPKSGSAPVTQDTIKTSAGAAFNIPIVKVDHLKDAVFYLQALEIPLVAATEKSENAIYDLPLSGPVAIIMGAEDKGISPAILKLADHSGKLPIMGSIASLNVSVACGVFLYEAVRQRTT